MLDFIKRFLGIKPKENKTLIVNKRIPHDKTVEFLDKVELCRFEMPTRHLNHCGATGEIDPNLPTLLIVDDLAIDPIYGVELDNIKRYFNFDIYKNFNVIQCSGNNSGIQAYKFIVNNKVDYAILDLTLGSFCKFSDSSSTFVEIDGVDIAISINNIHPDCKVLFCSAHVFNPKFPDFKDFLEKLNDKSNIKMENCYLNKLERDKFKEFALFLDVNTPELIQYLADEEEEG